MSDMDRKCPQCEQRGKISMLQAYSIHLTEKVFMCPNKECTYPFKAPASLQPLEGHTSKDVSVYMASSTGTKSFAAQEVYKSSKDEDDEEEYDDGRFESFKFKSVHVAEPAAKSVEKPIAKRKCRYYKGGRKRRKTSQKAKNNNDADISNGQKDKPLFSEKNSTDKANKNNTNSSIVESEVITEIEELTGCKAASEDKVTRDITNSNNAEIDNVIKEILELTGEKAISGDEVSVSSPQIKVVEDKTYVAALEKPTPAEGTVAGPQSNVQEDNMCVAALENPTPAEGTVAGPQSNVQEDNMCVAALENPTPAEGTVAGPQSNVQEDNMCVAALENPTPAEGDAETG